VHEHLQANGSLEHGLADFLPVGHLHETNGGSRFGLIFVSRIGGNHHGVNEEVLAWAPAPFFDVGDGDGFLAVLAVLESVHVGELIHNNSFLLLDFTSLLLALGLELLGKVVSVVRPFVGLGILTVHLGERSDFRRHLEVPDSVDVVSHR